MAGFRPARAFLHNARRLNSPLQCIRYAERINHATKFIPPSRMLVRMVHSGGPQHGTMDKLKAAYRDQPFFFSLAMFCLMSGVGLLGYANYFYIYHIVKPYHNFPEEVAKELRKASYYDNGFGGAATKDPRKALKYYLEALNVASDLGMSPFSEQVLGIRLRIADFMERQWRHKSAIHMLEEIRDHCYSFVEKSGDKHMQDGHRTRILGMTVKTGVKLGELYSSEAVDNQDAAEAALVMAVETYLKERQRRDQIGVQDGEGAWLSNEEAGASLEALGHVYLRGKKAEYALPLLLQALSLCSANSCHSATLMNDIAISLSEQKPSSTLSARPQFNTTPPKPSDLRDQAKLWVQKALTLSQSIKAPDRTEECDLACVTATHNLAELNEMGGNMEEATRLYREAKKLAKSAWFDEGVNRADEALKRLQST